MCADSTERWVPRELPVLTDYQLDCLQKFLQFELPIEALEPVLAPLITFELRGPDTLQSVHFPAGPPKNPIKVTRRDIDSAVEKWRTGQVTQRQLQQWAAMVELNPAFDWSREDEFVADLLNDLGSGTPSPS
jgi:hypothetical protein